MPDEPDAETETWADADKRTQEFQALLKKYDGDFQAATDAQMRGEHADPAEGAGNPNPM